MPTIADLERLDALLTRLIPLSDVRRGELIQATAWNTLVEALIEVTRAVLAEDPRAAVPDHDHRDAVAMSWLAPDVRRLLERGGLQDPVSEKRLRETERRSLRYNDQLGTLEGDLRSLRQRLDDALTRDAERTADVIRFDRQLQDLPRTRDDLQALQVTFDDLRGSLREALDLRDNLLVGGEPVDLADVLERLDAADDLRERLVRADGQLLDGAAFDLELRTLTNEFVGRDELDDILADRPLELSDEQLSGLQTQLGDELRAEQEATLQTRLDAFQQDVDAQVNDRLAGVDALVATAVTTLEADLRETMLATLRPEIEASVAQNLADVAGRLDGLDAALSDVRGSLDADLGGLREQLAGLEANLSGLQTDLSGLRGELGAVQQDVGSLRGSVDRLDRQTAALSGSVEGFDGRIREVEAATERVGALERSLGTLETQVAGFDANLSRLDQRLGELEGGLRTVSTRVATVNASLDTVRGDLDRVSTDLGGRVGTLERRGGGTDFRRLTGIGEALETRLREGGIATFEALSATDPGELSRLLSVSEDQARTMIREARRLLR